MKYLASFLLLIIFISCSSPDSGSDNTPQPQNNTLATVRIASVTDISENSATSGGNVTNDGGANVTSKGVCWSTSTDPTVNDSKTSNGSGTGSFISELTGLSPNTIYYVRTYAVNSVGTAYSNSLTFTTDEAPVVCGNILETGIELNHQTEVDDFGADGISIVNGTLSIKSNNASDPDPITDLSPFSCLQEVNGELNIIETPTLSNLAGLENLKHTKGLNIYQNDNITSIEALSNLETVDGHLTIQLNPKLQSLNGLNKVASVSGMLVIYKNNQIVDLAGLESVQNVGEKLWILINPKLQNLTGLNNLKHIGKSLWISQNPQISNIEALSNLETLTALMIDGSPLITSLSVFNNLTVSTIEYLQFTYLDGLKNLNGLEHITSITDYLALYSNSQLENIDALGNLTVINNKVEIWGNRSLKNINGLSNVSKVEYDLNIVNNPNLTDISGLNNLTTAGQIYIAQNDGLSNLSFNNLGNITHDLLIEKNTSLIDVNGLNNLTTIGGRLVISDNETLSNLNGLANLNSVGGDLKLFSYGALTDVCGIRPLLVGNGLGGSYDVQITNFDVTKQDIIDGNCSQ